MGAFLLSVASPESLSWIGFVTLAIALVGEVGVNVIPPKLKALHGAAAFGFAVLAALGYAVERIGDDAIIHGLENRASSAESELHEIKTPRTIDEVKYATLIACLKEGPRGPVFVQPVTIGGSEAQRLGARLQEALGAAGGFNARAFPYGTALSSPPGVYVEVRPDVPIPPFAIAIKDCLEKIGMTISMSGNSNQPTDAVVLLIGPKL